MDGDAGRVGAHPDAKGLPGRTIGVADSVPAVADGRVGDDLAVLVQSIVEPELASRELREQMRMQPSEVCLLGLRLAGEEGLDPLLGIRLESEAN